MSGGLKVAAVLVSIMSGIWWLFLWYKVLQLVGATELIWFLFWAGIPISMINTILSFIMWMNTD